MAAGEGNVRILGGVFVVDLEGDSTATKSWTAAASRLKLAAKKLKPKRKKGGAAQIELAQGDKAANLQN